MKKIALITLGLLMTSTAFANITPVERISINGFVNTNVPIDGYAPGTTPTSFNYDVGTSQGFGLGWADNHGQYWCTYQVLTTKNSDGTYNTTATVTGGNVQCSVTSTGTGSSYTPTFKFAQ